MCVSVCAKERFCILLRCLITIYGVLYYKRSRNMYKAAPNVKKMNVESFKLLKYDFKIFLCKWILILLCFRLQQNIKKLVKA